MNFQNIPPPPRGKEIIELAFARARRKGTGKKLKGNWLEILRKKESLKLDLITAVLTEKLNKVLVTYPGLEDLNTFYIKLMELTLDYPLFKKSCGAVNWAIKQIRKIHSQYISKIRKAKERPAIKQLSKEYYGRVSSVIKQINSNLDYLDTARKTLRTYPDIKDLFTVAIYGFPNVGKTTLLNKITKTKAEVAQYAFTTKTINSGTLKLHGHEIQILDVPGTLARATKYNNIELQAELVLEELANLVIYVFDLSEHGGFALEDQEKLYQKIKHQGDVLIYLSKQDITPNSVITNWPHNHLTIPQIKKEILARLASD